MNEQKMGIIHIRKLTYVYNSHIVRVTENKVTKHNLRNLFIFKEQEKNLQGINWYSTNEEKELFEDNN